MMESEERMQSQCGYGALSVNEEVNKSSQHFDSSHHGQVPEKESSEYESCNAQETKVDHSNHANVIDSNQQTGSDGDNSSSEGDNQTPNQSNTSQSYIPNNDISRQYPPSQEVYNQQYPNFQQPAGFHHYPYDRSSGNFSPPHAQPYPSFFPRHLSEQVSESQQQGGVESFQPYSYQVKQNHSNHENEPDEDHKLQPGLPHNQHHNQSVPPDISSPTHGDQGNCSSSSESGAHGTRFKVCQRGMRLDTHGFPIKKNGKLYKTKGYVYEKARAYYEKRMAMESPEEKAVRLEKARQRYYRKKEEREGLPMYHLGGNQPRRKNSSRYGQSSDGMNNNNHPTQSFQNNSSGKNYLEGSGNGQDRSNSDYLQQQLQGNHIQHPNLDPNVMFKLFPLLSHMNHPSAALQHGSNNSSNYYNPFPGVNYPSMPQDLSTSTASEDVPSTNVSQANASYDSVPKEHFGDLASKLAQFHRLRAMLDIQQQSGGMEHQRNPPSELEEKNITTSHGIDDIIPPIENE